jgi:two-component system sensor histidine kinase FlrB
VKDNGPGIKQEHLEQIFDPFISHKAKGTGLGLAIAMEAVIAHDGTLTVDNLDTGGACFVISLPFDGQIELTAENN